MSRPRGTKGNSGQSNTLLGAMDEDSKLKREEEKEETSLTPKRRDIAIDMASRCAAEKQTEKQTANNKDYLAMHPSQPHWPVGQERAISGLGSISAARCHMRAL